MSHRAWQRQDRNRVNEWKKYRIEYDWEVWIDKPSRHLFYNRMLKLEKPMEYCIQLKLPTAQKDYSKAVEKAKLGKARVYTNHKIEKEKKYNPDYYWVQVTYPLVEERINIMQAYNRQISQIQDKIDNADSTTDWELIRERTKQVNQLKREQLQFKLLNPLTY